MQKGRVALPGHPGGGFVFNTIHNIQPDVPVENIVAMWEALQEFGAYN